MGKAWDEVVATPCEFSVKNTFIDVQQDCHEINWQRQVSEPALMWQRQLSECQIPSAECQIAWAHPARLPTQESLEEPEGEPPRRMCTPEQETPSTRGEDASAGSSTPQGTVACAEISRSGGDEECSVQQPPPPPPLEWESMHTVMMRNLPNKYTQHMLMFEINQAGFHGRFDFLYLPIDPDTGANRGYAFLNFDDPSWAWLFKNTFEGRKMNHFNSGKVVSVHAAALQGFEANYAHYFPSRVNRGDPAMRPIFFREPSGDKAAGAAAGSGRKGRRRRSGGASAIDVAARKQQEQQQRAPTLESLPEPEALAMTEEAAATPTPAVPATTAAPPAVPETKATTPEAPAVTAAPQALPVTFIAAPSPSGQRPRLAAPAHSDTRGGVAKAARFCEYCDGAVEPHHHFCHFCGSTLAVQDVTCTPPPAPPAEAADLGFAAARQLSACGGGDVQAFPLCYILVPHFAPEAEAPSWTGA